MSEEESKKNYFRRMDVSETSRLLKESAKTKAPAYIWTKNHGHAFTTPIVALSTATQTIYVEKPLDPDTKMFASGLIKEKPIDCFFNIALPKANVFFKTFFKGHDTGGMRFQVPEEVFKVQRRQAVRVVIPPDCLLQFRFRDPLFSENFLEKKVLDISANGLALIVAERETQVFTKGTLLENAELTIKDRTINLTAEVMHVRALPHPTKSKAIKIGLEFKEVRPGDAQFIASFVFELSRRLYAKFA